jgi:probable 2-oxoglutarate dehydrogenase E1 component DHKTD1
MRTHGHRAARIDPLDLLQREEVAALNHQRYGLTDPNQTYPIDGIVWTERVEGHEQAMPSVDEEWSLEKIVQHLRAVYVGNVAYEFMHSPSKTERLWFMRELESSGPGVAQGAASEDRRVQQKKRIHEILAQSETFDRFLQLKFPNLKRYGLEGGESMLPAMDALFEGASKGKSQSDSFHCAFLTLFEYAHSRRFEHRHRNASPWPSESPYGLVAICTLCTFP